MVRKDQKHPKTAMYMYKSGIGLRIFFLAFSCSTRMYRSKRAKLYLNLKPFAINVSQIFKL